MSDDLALDLGGHVDLGPASMHALVSLGAGFDTLAKELKRINDREEWYQLHAPLDQNLRNSKVCPTPAPASIYIGMGGPAIGRVWFLRRLIVMGLTWSTMADATECNVHVTTVPNPVSGGMDMVDNSSPPSGGQALPNKAFYSNRQIAVHHPNHIIVEIVGPTAGQQYVVTGMADDRADSLRGMGLVE